MMRELITKFPQQLAHAIEIGKSTELKNPPADIRNVLICGLGGSGIGGKIMCQLIEEQCEVPVLTNNNYTIPAFVNQQTLVVISSYSGNTEETLQAMDFALEQGAEVAVITSGGQVLDRAEKHGLNKIVVPGGHPPRSQFGYSIVSQLFLFNHYGLLSEDLFMPVDNMVSFLQENQPLFIEQAKTIANSVNNTLPIIYSDTSWEGVAIRWRQQLNENSKMLCWHHVFPELNHNELVGWESGSNQYSVILLRTDGDLKRNQVRMDISKDWIEQKNASIVEVKAIGDNKLFQMIGLVHLGDWVSLILAEENQIDPVSIDAIHHLKSELAKLP
ncbi:MAG: bifunctional phosphoglucose/phosphomannose isomerase [Flavobacteriales bacterium]|nr:bifunctional phosphoglucose/phosphomannose isomerase [Flavobacteriales bacterium]